jgi:hypothetical protein
MTIKLVESEERSFLAQLQRYEVLYKRHRR